MEEFSISFNNRERDSNACVDVCKPIVCIRYIVSFIECIRLVQLIGKVLLLWLRSFLNALSTFADVFQAKLEALVSVYNRQCVSDIVRIIASQKLVCIRILLRKVGLVYYTYCAMSWLHSLSNSLSTFANEF